MIFQKIKKKHLYCANSSGVIYKEHSGISEEQESNSNTAIYGS